MSQIITTSSAAETKRFAQSFAKEILKAPQQQGAFVIGLCGELGSGKTTFVQGFVREFGIRQRITSPTYVLMKRYKIPSTSHFPFSTLYHIDCYRLESGQDLLDLGFKDISHNPQNIVLIEWPEKVEKILPESVIQLKFRIAGRAKRVLRYPIIRKTELDIF